MTVTKRDCHYCEYAMCMTDSSSVDCYCEDNSYFDHHVTDSKKEAEQCDLFEYCGTFPKC